MPSKELLELSLIKVIDDGLWRLLPYEFLFNPAGTYISSNGILIDNGVTTPYKDGELKS